MSYIVKVEDPEWGSIDEYYEETEEDAYNRGLDEIMLCDSSVAVFTIEDEDGGEMKTYNRDGEFLW